MKPDKPLRVSTLAARANISPSHYFAFFELYFGSSPIDCFIRLRLQYSCHRLENTSMSAKAIAYRVGYVDPLYFSRLFKSFYWLASSQYWHLKLKPEMSHRVLSGIDFPPTWCAGDLVWRQGSVELDQGRGSRDRRARCSLP
jgi:AraC-like DNA-binding protein